MYTAEHTLSALFMQLGLDSSDTAINEFIHNHHVPQNEPLDTASFWTPAQAQFIRESWHEDADWAGVIDQLDTLLRS
jgi:hypothetical protein